MTINEIHNIHRNVTDGTEYVTSIVYIDKEKSLDEIHNNIGAYHIHRDNGPAFICFNINGSISQEAFMQNNEYHRIGGPARIIYSEGSIIETEYYIFGKKLTEEEFENEDYKHTFIMEHS